MRRPTQEQKDRAEKKRQMFRKLVQKVAAMTETEKSEFMANFPDVATCEGHVLSNSNMMLVLMQSPGATIVGGFRQWQRTGRQVRKGEHGMCIWVPTASKEKDSGDSELRFLTATVFDVTQTDEIAAEVAA